MPKLRSLSGDELITIFQKLGFVIHSQKGSHVKLRLIKSDRNVQNLTIPKHKDIDKGTLLAIFRQASRFIPEEELRSFFYSE